MALTLQVLVQEPGGLPPTLLQDPCGVDQCKKLCPNLVDTKNNSCSQTTTMGSEVDKNFGISWVGLTLNIATKNIIYYLFVLFYKWHFLYFEAKLGTFFMI